MDDKIEAPKCYGSYASRDNHLGNGLDGVSSYYVWTIPYQIRDHSRCALRIRYNVTNLDFVGEDPYQEKQQEKEGAVTEDYFFEVDAAGFNKEKSLLKNNPKVDSVGLPRLRRGNCIHVTIPPSPGRQLTIDTSTSTSFQPGYQCGPVAGYTFTTSDNGDVQGGKLTVLRESPTTGWQNEFQVKCCEVNAARVLTINANTDQLGRVFQDRSHSFKVIPRPGYIDEDRRIVNYNVRGRRGNIVEVYPSVEYDFVPPNLHVVEGDYVHFQWAMSDANANNGGGNGRRRTDRANLVQVPEVFAYGKPNAISPASGAKGGLTTPLHRSKHTLLCNTEELMEDDDKADELNECLATIMRFAYLDQTACKLWFWRNL